MNERPHLEAWSASFFLAALVVGVVLALPDEGPVRQRTRPSLAAELNRTTSSSKEGLVLTDLEGWTQTPHPDSKPEVLTRLTLTLDAKGRSSAAPLESRVSWRGLRLPHQSKKLSPIVCSLNGVRVKLLLYRGQTPVREPGPDVRVVLKTGDQVHESFAALAATIRDLPAEAELVFDARAGVPARHAVTALAVLCRSGRAFEIAAPEYEARAPQPEPGLRDAIRRGVQSVARDARGLPRLGVRIRPDARCSWGSIQGVLEVLVRERVSRVTLSGNAGDLEVDLFQPRPVGASAPDRIEGTDPGVVEKPIIILEEEVDVEGTEVPGSERGVHPPVKPKDPLSAEPGTLTPLRTPRGVSAESEAAVAAALLWLKNHQEQDGRWRAAGKSCCARAGEAGDSRYDVGVTGTALLAFLGNGQSHRFGRHKRVVNRGLRFLKRLQAADGSLGLSGDFSHSAYNHAAAAQALSEAYAVSRDFTLKRYAERALKWILSAQVPGGGWRSDPTGGSDPALTGAMVEALLASRMAMLQVPEPALQSALGFLAGARGGGEGPAGRLARVQGKLDPLPRIRALSLFLQLYGGGDAKGALQGAGSLSLPVWDRLERKVDLFYWSAGSHAMVQIGGNSQVKWLDALHQALLPHQASEGCAAGSWSIRGDLGHVGGRAYTTALGALCLEAPYRYGRRAR